MVIRKIRISIIINKFTTYKLHLVVELKEKNSYNNSETVHTYLSIITSKEVFNAVNNQRSKLEGSLNNFPGYQTALKLKHLSEYTAKQPKLRFIQEETGTDQKQENPLSQTQEKKGVNYKQKKKNMNHISLSCIIDILHDLKE